MPQTARGARSDCEIRKFVQEQLFMTDELGFPHESFPHKLPALYVMLLRRLGD